MEGDATGLNKALKDVEGEIKDTQKALRDVNKLLRLDPTNTELLSQKQRLLKEAIGETEEKLSSLKEIDKITKAQMESGDLGVEKYEAIRREVIETENRLKNLKQEEEDVSNQMKSINLGTEKYEDANPKITETEKKIEKLGKTAEDAGKKVEGVANKTESFGNKAQSAANKIAPLSKAAGALTAAAFATVPATEELRTDLSKLDQNARESGAGIDAAREAFSKFNVVSDETDSSVEATANLLQAGFTESNLQKAVEGLSGAYLRFPDTLKIESLADSLQETLATGTATGQFGELLDRLGIGAENFSEKLAACANDAEKQNLALQTLADAGLMDSYEGWKKNNKQLVESKEASQEFKEASAELAETLQPIVTKVTEGLTKLIEKFNSLSPEAQGIIMIIVGIVAMAAPLLSMIGKVSLGISAITKVLTGLSTIGKVIAGGTGIIAIIGLVIAIIIELYNNCEWFRDGVNEIISSVVGFFENLGEKANEIFTSAAETISAAVSAIVSFFVNLKQQTEETWQKIKDAVIGTAVKLATDAVNAFTNMISGIKQTTGKITDVVKNGFQGAINFITGLPGKALGWGKDFIDGMAEGIKKAAGKLLDGVEWLADKISAFLHFSRPDEGPLHEYEKWMPDFMDGLAKGISKNQYKVTGAVKSLAGKLAETTINMNPVMSSGDMPITVMNSTEVKIGNNKFDDYIVNTASKGISKNRRNVMRAKGATA